MGLIMTFVMSLLLVVGATLHLLLYRGRVSRLRKATVFTLGAVVYVLSSSVIGPSPCFSHMFYFAAAYVGGLTSVVPAFLISWLMCIYTGHSQDVSAVVFSGVVGLMYAHLSIDRVAPRRAALAPIPALAFLILPLPWAERALSATGALLLILMSWHLELRGLRLSAMRHYLADRGYLLLLNPNGRPMMKSPALQRDRDLGEYLYACAVAHLESWGWQAGDGPNNAVPINRGRNSFLMTMYEVPLPMGETGIMAVFQDVTSVSTALRELARFFSLSVEGFCLLNSRGSLLVANHALAQMLGVSTEELISKELTNFAHPDDIRLFRSTLEEIYRAATTVARWQIRMRREDGAYIWVAWAATHAIDEGIIYAVVRDISEKTRREEALRQHNQKRLAQARMLEMTDEAIVVFAMDYTISYWNKAAEKLYGYQASQVLGRDGHVLLNSRFPVSQAQILLELMEKGEWQGVLDRTTQGGEPLSVDVRMTIRRDERGKPTEIIEMSTDVTELVYAELKRSHLAAIVENTDDAIISLSVNGLVRTWNRGAEKMFGYRCDEVTERSLYALLPVESYDSLSDLFSRTRSGETVEHVSDLIPHREGRRLHSVSVLFPIKDEEGRLTGISIVARDVTQQRIMENEAARLERLNVMGQLAAGIGHELRNPMTTVRGFLQLFASNPGLHSIRKQLDIMLRELDAANQIIMQFLSLARHRPLELQLLDLNDIIARVTPLLRADAALKDRQVEVKTSPLPRLWLGDREVSQLIINLARNGLQAMEPGGVLTISTEVIDGKVLLHVRDEGHGIPGEVADKIWTPFFTTRDGATGLGLTVCETIAEQHGARIVYTSHERGTTFTVVFAQESTSCT